MYCCMYCSYDLMRELQLGITFSIAQAALVSAALSGPILCTCHSEG